jgi:predicted ferric reductase
VIVAVAHGAIVDPTLRASTLLRVEFVIIGAVGIAAYGYRELLARFVVPIHDYTVARVQRLNEATIGVSLEPRREPLKFSPGQFIVLAFGGESGWERHPFTVASSPTVRRLDVAIKASGDYTSALQDWLRAGVPAKVAGPFGGFDYHRGDRQQVWIAGGIGITPFMSWIRALNGTLDYEIELFYSVAERVDAVYWDEIEAAARQYPTLHPRLRRTGAEGVLTPEGVLAGRGDGPPPWIFMCGPPAMMKSFASGFRARGVPRRQVRWEEFDLR